MENIEGKNIVLQKINNYNIYLLYEWRNNPSFLRYLTARPKIASFEDFQLELERDFTRDRHLQYLISYRNTFFGTIYSYSYNNYDRYYFISIFTLLEFKNSGLGITAVAIFCKYLFKRYNLFKIYFDIYDFNSQLVSALIKRSFKIEGKFIKQHLYEGSRYDVIRFAIYLEDINAWAKYASF